MAAQMISKFFVATAGVGVVLRSAHNLDIVGKSSVFVTRTLWTPKTPKDAKSLEAILLSDWCNEGPQGNAAAQRLVNYLHWKYASSEWFIAYADTDAERKFYEERFGLVEWLINKEGKLLIPPEVLEDLWPRGISVEVKSQRS